MLVIPPEVNSLIVKGLKEEIQHQGTIGKTCGNDWPNDYVEKFLF